MPIRVDTPLPDYLVQADTFDQGFLRSWAPGDRFQMFFGAKSATRTGLRPWCWCCAAPGCRLWRSYAWAFLVVALLGRRHCSLA